MRWACFSMRLREQAPHGTFIEIRVAIVGFTIRKREFDGLTNRMDIERGMDTHGLEIKAF